MNVQYTIGSELKRIPVKQYEEFRKVLDEMFDLHKAKNESYGSESILGLGERGVFVRMHDKYARLKNLIWNGNTNTVEDETVDDTLIDMACYSVIMLVLRRGKWGV